MHRNLPFWEGTLSLLANYLKVSIVKLASCRLVAAGSHRYITIKNEKLKADG